MPTTLLVILFGEIICAISSRAEFEGSLGDLTDRVIRDHFQNSRCVTYVSSEGLEIRSGQGLPAMVVRLPAEREILSESFEQNCGGYVVRVHNKSEAAELLVEVRHRATGSRYNNQKYLFLPADESDDGLELLDDPGLFFLPNLVLVTPTGDGLSAVTHTVFDHHKHDVLGVAREILDVWTPGKGFRFGNDLYPDKLSDLTGRKFVFGVLNYSPFSVVTKVGDAKIFDGFETRIAAAFVESVNGTWEGLNHPRELWGEVFPNGTGTGVVGSIMSHRADFGFSAFYQWFCEECECTYPIYQSGVTCLVPRPLLVSGWLTIILPFGTDTWIALIVVYFISSTFVLALILLLRRIKGLKLKEGIGMAASDSFFTNFRLQLEQVPVIPRSNAPLSVYVKIAVSYYFFVAAFWQGGIASILTVPRFEEPINDAKDLVQRWPKVKWGGNSNAWVNSIRASSEPNLIQIANKFVTHDDETLNRKTKTRDFAFFVEKLPHGHYGFSDYITEESMKYLRLMESNIYTAFGVFILPRGSPYLEKFDRTLLRLFDTGITHKLEVQVSLEGINNRLQNMIGSSNVKDTNTVILAIGHIQGPIFIYLGGMSLAAAIFILELWLCGRNQTVGIRDQDFGPRLESTTRARESADRRQARQEQKRNEVARDIDESNLHVRSDGNHF